MQKTGLKNVKNGAKKYDMHHGMLMGKWASWQWQYMESWQNIYIPINLCRIFRMMNLVMK